MDDLTFVVAACGRAIALHSDVKRNGDVRDEIGVQAYWGAAVVAYGRCFDSRGSVSLTEDDAERAGVLDDHRRFMALRHLHVAHKVDPHWERSSAAVILSPPADQERQVLGVHWLAVKHISAQPPEIERLRSAALALREPLQVARQAAMDEVVAETQLRPIDELYALPSVESPDVETTAMPSRPRSKNRR